MSVAVRLSSASRTVALMAGLRFWIFELGAGLKSVILGSVLPGVARRRRLSDRQRLPSGIAVECCIVRDPVGICTAGSANGPNVGVAAEGPREGDLSPIGGVSRIIDNPRKLGGYRGQVHLSAGRANGIDL